MALELDARQRAMLQEMGVQVWLPEPTPQPEPVAPPRPASARSLPSAESPGPAPTPAIAAPPAPVPSGAWQHLDGPSLAAQAQACQSCGLCTGRHQATLSTDGWPTDGTTRQTDWFIVGDPPDADEDRAGHPFVGEAGQLLDAMLRAAGARRDGRGRSGVYVSNVVKCHPLPGKVPQPAELDQCAHYLRQEIALVQPKLILAMGRFAAQALLQEHPMQAGLPLGKQRGRVYRYQSVPVVVTYHPKALLRNSGEKAKAWADLCLAMDVLDAHGRFSTMGA